MHPTAESTALRSVLPPLCAGVVLLTLLSLTDIVPAPLAAADPHRFTVFTAGAFAAAFVLHMGRRPALREVAATLVVAALVAAWDRDLGALVLVANALGRASLLVLAGRAALARGEARRAALGALGTAAVLPLFLVSVVPCLKLTTALHPVTYDGALYRLDAALGGQASFVVGRWFAALPVLRGVCLAVYTFLPLALALLLVVRPPSEMRGAPPRVSLMEAFVVAGALGFVLYHACPAAGPRYALFGDGFPRAAPPVEAVPVLSSTLLPVPRNCVPSLHTAWALLLLWFARPLGRAWVAAGWAWLAATLLATLGLGEHYVVDLVVAVPFAVGVEALVTRGATGKVERAWAIGAGAALLGVWVVAVRDPALRLAGWPGVVRALAVVTVGGPWLLHRRLQATARVNANVSALAHVSVVASAKARLAIGGVATAMACALSVHAAIAGRWVLLSIGGSAAGVLIAAYAGGMALGAWAGERMASRSEAPLRAYGNALVGFAVWCGLAGVIVPAVRAGHAALAPSAPSLVLAFATALVATLPASVIAGATLPLLGRELVAGGETRVAAVGLVTGASGGGVALGALGVTVLVPALGIGLSAAAAAVLPLVAALVALRLARSPAARNFNAEAQRRGGARKPGSLRVSAPLRPCVEILGSEDGGSWMLLCGGALTFAIAATQAHLFVVVAGDSVYAAALVVAALALGLAVGAAFTSRLPPGPGPLAALALGLAAATVAGALVWEGLPAYFASFDGYTPARGFAQREVVRFAVALVTLTPVAALGGALHAAALGRAGGSLGGLAALGTLGRGAGLLVGALVLGPRLGAPRAALASSAHVHFREEPRGAERGGDLAGQALGHTEKRGSALVLGPGDGAAAARALREAGFERVVAVGPDDGRARLLADRGAWDLVVIDAPGPWVFGAGALYTRDLYALVRRRLAPGGVLVETLPLAYVAREDVASILASVHAELPSVWIHASGAEGALVASASACPPREGAGLPLVDAAGVDRLVSGRAAEAPSTDDDLRLEWAAPRGNVRAEGESRRANLAFLGRPP